MGTKDLNCLYFEKFSNLLERYDLVKEIGKGGQATVFQCRSKWGSKKDCACKTIFKGANSVDRFERLAELRTELEIMRKLASRPGVVTLKEVIIDDGFWHLIMELCECSLYSRIEKEGRLCEREAALLIRNLARVVQDFHSLGVVHRDLKPGNVLITLGGKPYDIKVADFGLSISFSGSDVPCFTDEVGTPRYYAPEVLQGSYSKEVDIWGLGVILYEALTGMAVFSRLNDDDIEDRLRNGEDLTVTHLDWPAVVISEEAKHLILAMMHPNPEDRISLEQILSHPWVIKHSEVVELSKGACQNKLSSRRNACAYINKVKLRRAKGEYQHNSNLHGHGHLDDPTKQERPKREKSNDDTEKPESTRTLNRESGRGDVVPKRIKLQMLNGTWHVVKPCALVC